MRLLSNILCALFLAHGAVAMTLEAQLPDPVQEQTAQDLFHELRCIVCEGQSLAESDAVLAQQMRAEIRRRVAEGDSAAQVKAYFVQHYGTQILQRPPLMGSTLFLWAMPVLFLLVGAWLLRPRRRGDSQ